MRTQHTACLKGSTVGGVGGWSGWAVVEGVGGGMRVRGQFSEEALCVFSPRDTHTEATRA